MGNGRSLLWSDLPRTAGANVRASDVPCLLAVKQGEIVAFAPLRAFAHGKPVAVDERALQDWLDRAGVLSRDPPPLNAHPEKKEEEDVTEQEAEYYDCGVSGCEKTFHHAHV